MKPQWRLAAAISGLSVVCGMAAGVTSAGFSQSATMPGMRLTAINLGQSVPLALQAITVTADQTPASSTLPLGTATNLSGQSLPLRFSLTGPSGVSLVLSGSATAGNGVTLALNGVALLKPGRYPIAVTESVGAFTYSASTIITVMSPPSPSPSPAPPSSTGNSPAPSPSPSAG